MEFRRVLFRSFADFRQAPKATQHVAGQGAELVGIVLQALKLQRLLKIMHVGGAVHDPAVVAVCNDVGGFVFVGEVAGYGFEDIRSEEHTSELQSLMRISYAVFCLQKPKNKHLQNKKQ